MFRTLSSIYYDVTFCYEPWHIYDEVFYSDIFETITYLDSILNYSELKTFKTL